MSHVKTAVGLLAVAALALLACGDASEPAATTPATPAAKPAPPPAPAPPAEAPAPAPAPAAGAKGDAEAGKALYAIYCATCHGPRGAGDGPLAASLDPKPAHHDDGAYMNGLSDEHLFRVIKEGGAAVSKSPMMAAWGRTLSDDQIRDVVAFVRTLADPPYRP